MSRISIRVTRALHRYSLAAEWEMGNEVTVLFGRSGSGKTMSLKMLAGLETPDEGQIRIGKDVLFDGARGINLRPRKRRVGYVFQQAALFPHMTVEENVAFGTGRPDWRRQVAAVRPLLHAVQVGHLADASPSRISGGECQRVALARALAGNPRVLLLDEPFSGLDKVLRREMGALVLALRKRFPVPVVMVTHDPEEAQTLADRIVHYADGRTVDLGATLDLADGFVLPPGAPPWSAEGPAPAGFPVAVPPRCFG